MHYRKEKQHGPTTWVLLIILAIVAIVAIGGSIGIVVAEKTQGTSNQACLAALDQYEDVTADYDALVGLSANLLDMMIEGLDYAVKHDSAALNELSQRTDAPTRQVEALVQSITQKNIELDSLVTDCRGN